MQCGGDSNDENHSPQFARHSRGLSKEYKEVHESEVSSRGLSPLRTPPTLKPSRGVLQVRSQTPPPVPLLRPQSPKPLTAKPITTTASIPIIKPLPAKIVSPPTTISIPCVASPSPNPTHTTFTLHSINLLSSSPHVNITLSCRNTSHTTTASPTSPTIYIPELNSFSFIALPDAKLKVALATAETTLEVSIPICTKLTTVPLLHNDSIIGSVKFSLQNLQEDYFDDSASDATGATTPSAAPVTPATSPLSPLIMRSPYPRTPLLTPRLRRFNNNNPTTATIGTQTEDTPYEASARPSILLILAIVLLIIGSLKHILSTTSVINSNVSATAIPIAPATYCAPCPDVCDSAEEEAIEEINDDLLL